MANIEAPMYSHRTESTAYRHSDPPAVSPLPNPPPSEQNPPPTSYPRHDQQPPPSYPPGDLNQQYYPRQDAQPAYPPNPQDQDSRNYQRQDGSWPQQQSLPHHPTPGAGPPPLSQAPYPAPPSSTPYQPPPSSSTPYQPPPSTAPYPAPGAAPAYQGPPNGPNGYHPPPAGYLPPQSSSYPPPSSQPGPGYPPHGAPPHPLPPGEHRPEMMHIQPPPAHMGYRPHPMYDYYGGGYRDMRPHPYPPNMAQQAPRQRTAIACKYCRKRKIRCSGFESPEGRCTNCVRFSQECIFAPVASQAAQAFVPVNQMLNMYGRPDAPGMPPQLFGAFGQPIRAEDARLAPGQYPPPPPGQYPPYPPPGGQYPYPPHALPLPAPPVAIAPPPPVTPPDSNPRKRGASDTLQPSLPPPNPGHSASLPRTMAPELNQDCKYSDSTSAPNSVPAPASPVATMSSYHGPPASTSGPHPYYGSQNQPSQSRNGVPMENGVASDRSRASASPNTSTPGPAGTVIAPPPPSTSSVATDHHPPTALPLPIPAPARTPPAATAGAPPAPQTNGTNGHASPSNGHGPVQHSPTNGQQTNGRPRMAIQDMVTAGDGPGQNSIDAAMKARLGGKAAFA